MPRLKLAAVRPFVSQNPHGAQFPIPVSVIPVDSFAENKGGLISRASTIRIVLRLGEISTTKAGHFSIFSFPVAKARDRVREMRCNVCFDLDGVEATRVTETTLVNDVVGANFVAFVCARYLSLGRITRVTCKTFSAADKSLSAN